MTKFFIPYPHLSYTIGPYCIKGYYIYEWRDQGVPFYIGMGRNYRAWALHSAAAEERRELSTTFRVHIIQHHLTKQLAHRIERFRIRQRISQGYQLTNQRIPQC